MLLVFKMPSFRLLIFTPEDAHQECERINQVIARVGKEANVGIEASFLSDLAAEKTELPSNGEFDLVTCILRQSASAENAEHASFLSQPSSPPDFRADRTARIPDFLVFIRTCAQASPPGAASTVSPWEVIEQLLREYAHPGLVWENQFTTAVHSYSGIDQFASTFEWQLRCRLGERYLATVKASAFPKGDALADPDHFFERLGAVAPREVLSYVNDWLRELRGRWRRERRQVALGFFLMAAMLATAITVGGISLLRFHRSLTSLTLARAEKRTAEQVAQSSMDARNKSEQLTYQIISDLAEKLKPARRVDLLDSSLGAIQKYQADTGRKEPSAMVAGLRVTALDDRGDLIADEGKSDAALSAYRDACGILEKLADQQPARSEWRTQWAVNLRKMGDIQASQGKPNEAVGSYQQSVGLWQKLAESNPDNRTPREELVATLAKLAAILTEEKQLTAARGALEQERELIRDLANLNPLQPVGWLKLRSVCNQLGGLEVKTGDLNRAVRAYVEQLSVEHKLVDLHPTDTDARRHLATCQERIGYVLEAQGKLTEAQSFYEQELGTVQELADHEPDNKALLYDLSVSHENIGGVFREQGEPGQALASFQKGLGMVQQLTRQDPAVKKWQRQLSICLENYGSVLADLEQTPAALQAYAQSREICEASLAADPTNPTLERDLADCLGRQGDLFKADGNLNKALADYHRSLKISESLVFDDENNPVRRQALALAFQRMAEASALGDKLDEATGYYQVSCDIFERLLRTDGDNPTWREFLADGRLEAGKLLARQGKSNEAKDELDQAENLLIELRKNDQLDQYGTTLFLGTERALGKHFPPDGGVIAELRELKGNE
jgi:tetratricopeptide (TPR) repeat protein